MITWLGVLACAIESAADTQPLAEDPNFAFEAAVDPGCVEAAADPADVPVDWGEADVQTLLDAPPTAVQWSFVRDPGAATTDPILLSAIVVGSEWITRTEADGNFLHGCRLGVELALDVALDWDIGEGGAMGVGTTRLYAGAPEASAIFLDDVDLSTSISEDWQAGVEAAEGGTREVESAALVVRAAWSAPAVDVQVEWAHEMGVGVIRRGTWALDADE